VHNPGLPGELVCRVADQGGSLAELVVGQGLALDHRAVQVLDPELEVSAQTRAVQQAAVVEQFQPLGEAVGPGMDRHDVQRGLRDLLGDIGAARRHAQRHKQAPCPPGSDARCPAGRAERARRPVDHLPDRRRAIS
jgi:hypothetical protein